MKIRLICVEDGLENVGFKKLAAYVKSIHQNTKAAYVPTGNVYSLLKHITEKGGGELNENDIHLVAKFLAEADIVGLCSMTQYSKTVYKIISATRRFNPKAYIEVMVDFHLNKKR